MARIYLKVPFRQKDSAKALGAKWDSTLSSWYVPEGLDVVAFSDWLLPGSSSVTLASTTLSARELTVPGTGSAELLVPKTAVTLSRLLAGVASAVAAAYKSGVWTVVEVAEVKLTGRHVYLDLSERDPGGNLIAKARGIIWEDTANRILPEFERATGATLAPGIKLLVRARPVFKPMFGFSVDIDAIDPDYTLGDLEARKREIRSRLRAEGLFEAQSLLPAPWDFNAVLVIAPEGAAGLGDFQAEAHRLQTYGVCRFVYVASRFQGEESAAEIVAALTAAMRSWGDGQAQPPDAVVIIRGGGAVNDLAWLNDYALARFVCELPVPVFTGIGHERDSTVIDEVAHTKFDTPSKVVAGIEQVIVRRIREAADAYAFINRCAQIAAHRARASVQALESEVRAGAVRQVASAKRMSTELFTGVKEVSVGTVRQARTSAQDALAAVSRGSGQTVATAGLRAKTQIEFLLERSGSHVLRERSAADSAFALVRHSARRTLDDAKALSEGLMREIAGQGPQKTLGRGFAMVLDAGGNTVTRVEHVLPGQAVSVAFSDGAIAATIDKVEKTE
jgi:exodeoxyribonuclease VII large subunit